MSTPRRKAPAKPPKQNNPYGIDPKVWSKIVGRRKPTIERIMFAAALDPLLIHELDEIQPPRSFVECVQLADMGTRGDLRSFLKGVLIKRVMSNSDTVSDVVREIASWDIRFGVWCAAACAESVLRFVPEGEDRPRLAVEAAKGWVLGVIDRNATYHAYAANADAAANDAADAAYAANADGDAAYAAFAASAFAASAAAAFAASAAASANAYSASAANAAYAAAPDAHAAANAAYAAAADANASRNVIARAIESYPVDQP